MGTTCDLEVRSSRAPVQFSLAMEKTLAKTSKQLKSSGAKFRSTDQGCMENYSRLNGLNSLMSQQVHLPALAMSASGGFSSKGDSPLPARFGQRNPVLIERAKAKGPKVFCFFFSKKKRFLLQSSSLSRRTSTSRLPTWFAGDTTPSFSICSISFAARL